MHVARVGLNRNISAGFGMGTGMKEIICTWM